MDGAFLGPAIMTGRLAGQTIAKAAGPASEPAQAGPHNETTPVNQTAAPAVVGAGFSRLSSDLAPLLAKPRDGFWHFEVSHKTVVERKYACTMCHTSELPFAPITTRAQRDAQTQVCINCHDR
jgi:hypothetical protein